MPDLVIRADVETRSRVDIAARGSWNYFADPSTEVLLCAWQLPGERVELWDCYTDGWECPPRLAAALLSGMPVSAFNAGFERRAFRWLAEQKGWPMPAGFRCTQAIARTLTLPDSLGDLAVALGLTEQKDKEGERLIELFSVPGPDGQFRDPRELVMDWFAFGAYCRQDVRVEAAADQRMHRQLSDREQRLWEIDQAINDRGIAIDYPSLLAGIALVEQLGNDFDAPICALTGGMVKTANSHPSLRAWLNQRGYPVLQTDKATLEQLQTWSNLDPIVAQVLELRLNAGKSSVTKLAAIRKRIGHDCRLRDNYVYHRARTGRFQSSGVNLYNLPRPRKAFEKITDLEPVFAAIQTRNPEALPMMFGDDLGNPLHLLADSIRSFIVAGHGQKLLQGDYTGIEAVVISWLAGEQWKLNYYRRLITEPELPDLYRVTAASIVDSDTDAITKQHPFRQLGKVAELSLGYAGGVGALTKMARGYKLDFAPFFEAIAVATPLVVRNRARGLHKAKLSQSDPLAKHLSEEAWLAADMVKRNWRRANPAIEAFWYALEEAARAAVRNPGETFHAGDHISFRMWGNRALIMRLPSGRPITYPLPKLKDQVKAQLMHDGHWGSPEIVDRDLAEMLERAGTAKIEDRAAPKVTVADYPPGKSEPRRYALYGGLLAENCTQAVARDILTYGMQTVEEAGLPIVLHVYDEIVCEVAEGGPDDKTLAQLMLILPPWGAEIPLTAAGYTARRYRKG